MANSRSQRLARWLDTPQGARLLREETAVLAEAARRFHGDTLLWAGCHEAASGTVRGCMVRNRLYASETPAGSQEDFSTLRCALEALPLPNNSLDAMVLHHALETAGDARSALREAARALVPGGRLLICAFNPVSLWGLRIGLGGLHDDALRGMRCVTTYRLLDWLALLGFQLQGDVQYLAYGLPFTTARDDTKGTSPSRRWLTRLQPPVGGVYVISVVKHAVAMRPLWRATRVKGTQLIPAAYPKSAVNRNPAPVLQLSDWKDIERSR